MTLALVGLGDPDENSTPSNCRFHLLILISAGLRAYAQQRNAQRFVRLTRMIENPREIPAPGVLPPVVGYMNHALPPVGPPPPYSALPQPYSFQSNMNNSMSGPNNVRGSGYSECGHITCRATLPNHEQTSSSRTVPSSSLRSRLVLQRFARVGRFLRTVTHELTHF